MQIILVQSEVEDALKDYISNRLTIAPNTDIQIDLAATRGAEGVKAIIDLIPQTATTTNKPATSTTRKTAAAAATTAVAPTPISKPAAATPTAAAAEIKAADSVMESAAVIRDVNQASGTPAEAPETAQGESAAAETTDEPADGTDEAGEGTEAAAEPPATPPVRSLFANLRKPQNG